MPNGTYGGVRGRKTRVGRKLRRFPPTRFIPAGFPASRNLIMNKKFLNEGNNGTSYFCFT